MGESPLPETAGSSRVDVHREMFFVSLKEVNEPMRKILVFAVVWFAVVTTVAIPVVAVAAQGEPVTTGITWSAFVWTFVGALLFILGGWLKKTPAENFSGSKAVQTLVIALLVSLISIAFNIPAAEALSMLDQWTTAFLQVTTSTGLIALIEFWRQVIWRRLHPTQMATGPPNT